MTAQITDTVKYRGPECEILAVENEFPFDLREHGFNPAMMHTACYRGYFCLYVVQGRKALSGPAHDPPGGRISDLAGR